MTAGDFISPEGEQDLALDPTYPTLFGMELSPPTQALAIVVLGVAASFALYNFLVRPLRQEISVAQGEVSELQAQVDEQRTGLQEIATLQAQLDGAMEQRVAVYELLGSQTSLDTLLLDINQQIQNSNATLEDVLRSDINRMDPRQLAALGISQAQMTQVRTKFARSPANQRLLYGSELLQFTPTAGVIAWAAAPPQLTGKIDTQSVEVSMQALFPQTLSILRNIERLEPLIIIRDLAQEIAPLRGGITEEQVKGLPRPLKTTFTLEVLVPAIDPTAPPPPPPPPPPAEGEAGAEGAPPPEEAPPP